MDDGGEGPMRGTVSMRAAASPVPSTPLCLFPRLPGRVGRLDEVVCERVTNPRSRVAC